MEISPANQSNPNATDLGPMAISSVLAASPETADPNPRQIIFDSNADRDQVAEQALADADILASLIDNLAGSDRRLRQFSAGAIAAIANSAPQAIVAYMPQIADALHRPEAQTRWECLDALTRLVALDPEAAALGLSGAEDSLYDEESGAARLGAIRFLAAYGALDSKRSQLVWPYLDEAIQCYHGDPEFQDILIAVIGFAGGRLAKSVRQALAARMSFDAENARGPLKRRAAEIIELCSAATSNR